jgi:hypothetical protein
MGMGKTSAMPVARAVSRPGVSLLVLMGGWMLSCGSSVPSSSAPAASNSPFFAQWALDSEHNGMVGVVGQGLSRQIATFVYDPLVPEEQAEAGGELLAHYQATLVDGNDFYMEAKSGSYPSCSPPAAWASGAACGPNAWGELQWGVTRYTWENGAPVQVWSFQSDWKPEPNGNGLNGWEPVFHSVLANGYLYVPGAGGSLWKVDKNSGASVSKITPLSSAGADPSNTFVAGPPVADGTGTIYYNALWLSSPTVADPWVSSDVLGAWLVKIRSDDSSASVPYAALVPGAPQALAATCPGSFSDTGTLPWPPSPMAVPPTRICGSQRPGLNVAPAVAPDGTIYTVSRAHFDPMAAYLVAVHPDLTPKWQASLQRRLNDGCGVVVPIGQTLSEPNTCRPGARQGVDPTTNDLGSGSVVDQASSSPTVLPDGSILFGALTFYNALRGHLFKFDASGKFLAAFDFGWDTTPAVYAHDGTYSIILKDNHYNVALYCPGTGSLCPALPLGPYYITQLDPELHVEWQFQSPSNFEWCVNAPIVDSAGTVYASSEDGNLYALPQGQSGVFMSPAQRIFLKVALGAAYTPVAIGPDGRIYSQNDGSLFIVGN